MSTHLIVPGPRNTGPRRSSTARNDSTNALALGRQQARSLMGALVLGLGMFLGGCGGVIEPDALEAPQELQTQRQDLFGEGATLSLVSKHSGKCVDVSGISLDNGALVYQWPCRAGDNQAFWFIDQGDGSYKIVARHSGKCLDVTGISRENGALIQQWDCEGGDNQRFWLRNEGGNTYKIVSKHSGKCLDVRGISTETGAPLQQWDCEGGDNQRFRLQRSTLEKSDCANRGDCVADPQTVGGTNLNCTYGIHVGAGWYHDTSTVYDELDRCAFWHDKSCWSVNHLTWVDEGFAGCSQTVNFIACVERVTPRSPEEQAAKDCVMASALKGLADFCEPTYPITGQRGLMYPLYSGSYTGGRCASSTYGF